MTTATTIVMKSVTPPNTMGSVLSAFPRAAFR